MRNTCVIEYTHFPNTVNTHFQVRHSQIVIPDLIREPVVFRHVGGLRVYSSVLNQVQDDGVSSTG